MKRKLILAAILWMAPSISVASSVGDEIQRLEDVRDAKIHKCTSLECRERARDQFQASVNKLRSSPEAYYGEAAERAAQRKYKADVRGEVRRELNRRGVYNY